MEFDLSNKKTAAKIAAVFVDNNISAPVTRESILNACREHGSEFTENLINSVFPVVSIEGGNQTPKKKKEPVYYSRIFNLPTPIFGLAVAALVLLVVVISKK